jgi:hypothetical protein
MTRWFNALTALTLSGLAMASAHAATQQGTFTVASVDIFDNSSLAGSRVVVDPTGSPIVVDLGPSPSGAYGKARAELGSNGFLATSGAAGFSAWADGFTLTGGTGAGELDLSIAIHGDITGVEADMAYGLYASNTPFGIDTQAGLGDVRLSEVLARSTRILSYDINNAGAPPNTTLTGRLAFTYGQPFYLLSYFLGDVCTPLEDPSQSGCTGGSEDFYHSAVFGITAPQAAAIDTLSGHAYAAAVPEAASWAMLCVGLLTLSVSGLRSQRARQACHFFRPIQSIQENP